MVNILGKYPEQNLNIADEVLDAVTTPGSIVEHKSYFVDEDFGEDAISQRVNVLLTNRSKDSHHISGFSVRFVNKGKVIGVFNVSNQEDHWCLNHRRVDPDYQGMGLWDLAMNLIEDIVERDGLPLEVDPIEPDVRDENGEFYPHAVQIDTLGALQKRGYVPVDDHAELIIEQIREGVGFKKVDISDSGPKAIPLQKGEISIPMRKGLL